MTYLNYTHIGVSTNLFHNPKKIVETVSYCSKDFSVIELELEHSARTLLNADSCQIETTVLQLNKLQESKNLHLSVHAPYIGSDCNLAAEDEQVRRVSCELLRRVIQLSAQFGVKRITYHPGYASFIPILRLLDNLKHSLDVLVPEAAARGIELCLENTGAERPSYLLFSPQQYVELSQQTGTYLTLDLIHHASLFSKDGRLTSEFFETLLEMLPYVKNVHFADMEIPKHVHLPIGKGNMPVLELLDFLRDRNYQGNMIIEETGGSFSSNQFFAAACNFRNKYRDETLTLPTHRMRGILGSRTKLNRAGFLPSGMRGAHTERKAHATRT